MRTSRVIALALIVAAFFVGQEVVIDLADGKPAKIGPRLTIVVCYWLAWALLTPLVRFAVRRWPLDTKPLYRPLLAQIAAAIVLAAVQAAIELELQAVVQYIRGTITLARLLSFGTHPVAFIWGASVGVIFYAIVVITYTALRYRTMFVAVESELTQAKLDTLRSQLRPHFLFNTLNAISVFVTEDAGKAQQMLLRLSTLLRRSLDEEAHVVPLDQELGFVNDYLDIQRGRFGDDLIIRVAVDQAVRSARVPVFLLQPLLENAIEHGKSEDKPTTIALSACREADLLHITLTDDGPGLAQGGPVRDGIGLKNTRERLHHLFGPRAAVELSPASPGARVDIRIPYESTDRR